MTDGDRFEELDEPLSEDRRSGEASDTTAPDVERPETTVPTPEVPSPSAPSTRTEELQSRASSVDPEFKTLFWKLVLMYKLGIIGLTLGILLSVFRSHPTRGPALTAGGIALLLYAVVLTRRAKRRLDNDEYDLDTDGRDADDRDVDADEQDFDSDEQPTEEPSQ